MRIAFLTPEYPTNENPDGGLANYLAKLCPLLRSRGHEPVVFVAAGEARRDRRDDIDVISLPRPSGDRWWLRGPLRRARLYLRARDSARHLARAFLSEHARRPFDIVQASSYGAVGATLAGRCPVPLVIRLSSFTPLLRAAYGRQPSFGESLADRLEIRALRRADALFSPSSLMASTIERSLGLHARVIRSPFIMPPAAEDDTLLRSFPPGRRYWLFFGTMSRIKGIDLLAEALPEILDAHPDVDAVFVGRDDGLPGGRPCADLLLEAAGARRDRVRILDRQIQARLIPILRRADAVVLPSRMDNYPNTCLEAQALGRIVIGTRGSSLDEMIEDGVTGFLADQNPRSIARAVGLALSLDDAGRRAMESAIAALAPERDPQRSVDDLLAFYAEAIRQFKDKRGAAVSR